MHITKRWNAGGIHETEKKTCENNCHDETFELFSDIYVHPQIPVGNLRGSIHHDWPFIT